MGIIYSKKMRKTESDNAENDAAIKIQRWWKNIQAKNINYDSDCISEFSETDSEWEVAKIENETFNEFLRLMFMPFELVFSVISGTFDVFIDYVNWRAHNYKLEHSYSSIKPHQEYTEESYESSSSTRPVISVKE